MSIKNERLLSKAKKLLKKGHFDEAQDIYLKIIKSFPNNKEAKKGLFTLNKSTERKPSRNQLDEVLKFFSNSQFDKAQLLVQKLIKDNTDDSLLFNISGACYSEKSEIIWV